MSTSGEKKKSLEGLAKVPGQNKYASSFTKNDLVTYKIWRPGNGCDLNRDSVLKFTMKTPIDQLIR